MRSELKFGWSWSCQASQASKQAGSKERAFQLACGRLLSVHAVAVDKVVSFARFRASDEGRFLPGGRRPADLFARVRCFGAAAPLAQTVNSGLDGFGRR